jgi:ABC-2 type transport system permease protein
MLALFVFGVVLFDLQVAGRWAALILVVVTFSLAMLSFGMAITSLSRTSLQLNTYVNLAGIVFAGVGGALVPLNVLPEWVQNTARFVPTYWAMEGFLDVILDGGGMAAVAVPSLALVGFTGAFAGIAAARFRFEESKVYVS